MCQKSECDSNMGLYVIKTEQRQKRVAVNRKYYGMIDGTDCAHIV